MQNNPQIWVVLIVLAFSGISWLFRVLKEQAEKKNAEQARQRRIEELLRTGRDPNQQGDAPTAAPATEPLDSAQARLREIAARRQAQLRELRRKQQGAGTPESPTASAAPAAPGSDRAGPSFNPPVLVNPQSGPVPGAGMPGPRPMPPIGPSTDAARMEEERRRAARAAAKARNRAEAERRQALQRAALEAEGSSSPIAGEALRRVTLENAQENRDRLKPRPAAWNRPSTPAEWRAAFIAAEVLSPPLALRGGDHTTQA